MTDEERISIADPVNVICERLGLKPSFVRRLDIYPDAVTATVYAEGIAEGSKLIDPRTGDIVLDTHLFKVRTW